MNEPGAYRKSAPSATDSTALGPPVDLVSPNVEARALWRSRRQMAWTVVRQTWQNARFRVALAGALSALLWLGLYWLTADGFAFLFSILPVMEHDRTARYIFGIFYLTLMVMLVFSGGIILYSSLFRSPDVPLLLTLPTRAERVFLHKLQEAILLASWAFLLLGSPMLVAYGVVEQAPWYYFAMLLPYLVAFACIPAGIGAILCLLVVYFLPRGRSLVLFLAATAMLGTGVAMTWSLYVTAGSDLMTATWFQQMLNRLTITENKFLPSWWLSKGLLSAAAGARETIDPYSPEKPWADSVMFLALLISNALAIRQISCLAAARLYRPAYWQLQVAGFSRWRSRSIWIDRLTMRMSIFTLPMRLLMVKDLRLFRRDPVQWSQFLIFVGLLGVYFLNIRPLRYDRYYVTWVNMVSFLNLAVVGLLFSTFTTRFVFPMISLEGRRFWILGLLGVRRETVLWSKFAFAVCGSIIPCSVLILLSDWMLRVEPWILVSHQLTCLLLCFGLSGIAVGLGAKMPNLREESPSKIAAGFGGTLNLVLSTLYILAVVLLTALPCHFYLGSRNYHAAELIIGHHRLGTWIQFWLVAGTATSIVLGVIATVVPLRIGFAAFRRLEF